MPAEQLLELGHESSGVLMHDVPDHFVRHDVVAMYEQIAEADDPPAVRDVIERRWPLVPDADQSLADDQELPLDRGAQQLVCEIPRKILAAREADDALRRGEGIGEMLSSCIQQLA